MKAIVILILSIFIISFSVCAQFGNVLAEIKLVEGINGFTASHGFENLRESIGIGDVDGDGINDIAIGIPYDDDGGYPGSNRGSIFICMLNADGSIKVMQKISETQGGLTGVLVAHSNFGEIITPLGDLDGDGVPDIGVNRGVFGSPGLGIWILFLNSDGTVKSVNTINNYGRGGALLGDLDGDGVQDIASGDWLDDDAGTQRGAVYILFLNPDGSLKASQKINDTQGGFSGVLHNNDRFGWKVAGIGDLDQDGVVDLAVNSSHHNDAYLDFGAVWILFLNTDGTVKTEQIITATKGGFTGDGNSNESFGSGIAGLGDLDGDGVLDIAVGARYNDESGSNAGCVWIFFLNTDGTIKSQQKINNEHGLFTGPIVSQDYFGSAVTFIGDLNGDTHPEIGVLLNDDAGTAYGGVYILSLQGTAPSCFDGVQNDLETGIDCGGPLCDPCTDTVCHTPSNLYHSVISDSAVILMWDHVQAADSFHIRGRKKGTSKAGKKFSDTSLKTIEVQFELDAIYEWQVASVCDSTTSLSFSEPAEITIHANPLASVKSVQKISQTEGGFTGTLALNDKFSRPITIGDMDGDGIEELAVGAAGNLTSNPGGIWILYMNSDQTIKTQHKLTISGSSNLGSGLASLGDLDGDGTVDILSGARGENAVYILFLNPDGSIKSSQRIAEGSGGFTGDLDMYDSFGSAVEVIGDLDGDSVQDIAIGAKWRFEGVVYIAFLNADGTVKSHQEIDNTFLTSSAGTNAQFGSGLASIGDLDNDGVNDLAVGSGGDDCPSTDHGSVYILFLHPDGTVKSQSKICGENPRLGSHLEQSDWFGSNLAALGDVDGDGTIDLAVGAHGDDDGGSPACLASPPSADCNLGAVYVLFLNGNGSLKDLAKLSAADPFLQPYLNEGDFFGSYISKIGDFNLDGVPDLAVGAANDDDGGFNYGAFYIISLNSLTDTICGELDIAFTSDPASACCEGSLLAIASGGAPPYSYTWSTVSTDSAQVHNLCPGIYSVEIEDANGCLIADSFTLIESPVPGAGGLALSSISSTSATLTWSANPVVQKYRVFLEDMVTGEYLGGVTFANSFVFAGLNPGNAHRARVQSVCAGVGSPFGDVLFFSPPAARFGSDSRLDIFPNPASEVIYIEAHNFDISYIELTDRLGRVLKRIENGKLDRATINVQSLNEGIYFIRIATNTEIKVHPVLIE